jgi:hypothetical protein
MITLIFEDDQMIVTSNKASARKVLYHCYRIMNKFNIKISVRVDGFLTEIRSQTSRIRRVNH